MNKQTNKKIMSLFNSNPLITKPLTSQRTITLVDGYFVNIPQRRNLSYLSTTRSITFKRKFRSTSNLSVNDQEKLFEEISDLQTKKDCNDADIRKLQEGIQADEVFNQVGEGETSVSKYIEDRMVLKDRLEQKTTEEMGAALYDRKNPREEKSILLGSIAKDTQEDKETLEALLEDFSDDARGGEITEILGRLRDQEAEAAQLIAKMDENTLPPILSTADDNVASTTNDNVASPSQNSSNSFPQDSSDVHQDDFD